MGETSSGGVHESGQPVNRPGVVSAGGQNQLVDTIVASGIHSAQKSAYNSWLEFMGNALRLFQPTTNKPRPPLMNGVLWTDSERIMMVRLYIAELIRRGLREEDAFTNHLSVLREAWVTADLVEIWDKAVKSAIQNWRLCIGGIKKVVSIEFVCVLLLLTTKHLYVCMYVCVCIYIYINN